MDSHRIKAKLRIDIISGSELDMESEVCRVTWEPSCRIPSGRRVQTLEALLEPHHTGSRQLKLRCTDTVDLQSDLASTEVIIDIT